MATPRDIVKGALRILGVIAAGETPTSAELSDGLTTLNEMLESWSLEKLTVPKRTRETFSLVANQASYTIGPWGGFSTERPVKVDGAGVVVNDIEYPIQIITAEEWARIDNKGDSRDLPTKLYAVGTSPLDTLYVWPVPSQVATLALYSQNSSRASQASRRRSSFRRAT
ncbi:MAG: hypothetical protein HC883_00095 [Bdellovibrionaceae bacterium]|nr:hypothetical protein [Pseudobdellovibrionaceae bacterium]